MLMLREMRGGAGHADKSLHTQLAVDTREVFLDYRHNSSEATDVTFNLKDFKAVLVLCEGLGTNVAICFDQPGSPLLVQPTFHSSNPLVRLCSPACRTTMYCSQEIALELKSSCSGIKARRISFRRLAASSAS